MILGALTVCAACALPASQEDDEFPIIIGTTGDDVQFYPCTGYGSRLSYTGHPYNVRTGPGRAILRHRGLDFCGTSGTEVIAVTAGTIDQIIWDHPRRGGSVTLRSGFRAALTRDEDAFAGLIYFGYVHITPNEDLRIGMTVEPGEVLGVLQPPGKVEIGPRSHVHFTAGNCPYVPICHTDPNRFWQNGPGNVTCFDEARPPEDDEIVAPLRC